MALSVDVRVAADPTHWTAARTHNGMILHVVIVALVATKLARLRDYSGLKQLAMLHGLHGLHRLHRLLLHRLRGQLLRRRYLPQKGTGIRVQVIHAAAT